MDMDNCWISCQGTADMKKVYDNLIIINLYNVEFEVDLVLVSVGLLNF